jgi:hypothetical protein
MAEAGTTEQAVIGSTGAEPVAPIVRKNPFGLEAPAVDATRRQEIEENVKLAQQKTERNKLLKEGKIPVEEMDDSEKAAYLLRHLKDPL